MRLWEKIMAWLNKIRGKEEIKTLAEPKAIRELPNTLEHNIEVTLPKKTQKEPKQNLEIETLVCPGDGLGIQREIRS